MSKLRVDELETLDGLNTKNVGTLIDDVSTEEVTTSTGTQVIPAALDDRVNKGSVGSENVTTETGTQSVIDALNARATDSDITDALAEVLLESSLTVNIPTDYATLQEAVDALSTLNVKQGEIIDLVIESGHQPTAGILVENGDFGKFRVSSIDATVTLPVGFPATDFIKGLNARMPVLNCLVDANGNGQHGYHADEASFGVVTPGNGVINAGRHGLAAYGASVVYADNTTWTGASQETLAYAGILAWASRISAAFSDVSNSLYYGAQAAAGGILSFRGGTANNTGRYGVRATNLAFIDAREVQAEFNVKYGIYAYIGSTINCMGSDVDQNGEANIIALRSSTIDASIEGGSITTCNGGGSVASVYAAFNSRIHAGGIQITNAQNHAILAEACSVVNANTSTINSSAGQALRAVASSTINAVNATIDNAAYAARCNASIISVRSATITNISTTPVYIEEGATVQAHGTTVGGAAFSTSHTNADTLNGFSSTGASKGLVWA